MLAIVVTDTHWGCRSESPIFMDAAAAFFRDQFFPTIDAHGIKLVLHLGDLVDRRKYVAFSTARRMREAFIEPLLERGVELVVTPGNHDLPYKNIASFNAERELLPPHPLVRVVDRPSVRPIDGRPVLMLPWICDENRDESLALIRESRVELAMGHLELEGFEMHRGKTSEHGLSPSLFNDYEMVLSGHYHHKSTRGPVHYLGAPYEMTWSDYADPRGFHILNTDTLELQFVQNERTMFAKVYYDDEAGVPHRPDLEAVKDKIVKLIVKSKTRPTSYDSFIECLSATAHSIQPVDDHLRKDVVGDLEIVGSVPNTLSLLTACAEEAGCDRAALRELLEDLYKRAQEIEA